VWVGVIFLIDGIRDATESTHVTWSGHGISIYTVSRSGALVLGQVGRLGGREGWVGFTVEMMMNIPI
jgi:hypothetical protein